MTTENADSRAVQLLDIALTRVLISTFSFSVDCASVSGTNLMHLYEVEILGVAQRLLEQQLVDRGAAAECNLAAQRRRIEQVAERPPIILGA
jgi:hypothetical protein